MWRKLFFISLVALYAGQTLADTINKNAPMLWANQVLKLIGEDSYYSEPVYLPSSESGKNKQPNFSNTTKQVLVSVYPNPTSDLLNVSVFGADTLSVHLYTIDGKLLTTKQGSFGSAVLNVKGFETGVYLLKV